MTEPEILELIKKHVSDILPELEEHQFQATDSLVDLGADSVDRAEILNMVLEDMALQIPRTELFGPKNIGELAALLHKRIDDV